MLERIPKNDLFGYLVFFIIVTAISGYIPIQVRHTLGFFVAVAVIGYLIVKRDNENLDTYTALKNKMEQFNPKPKYFYIDANFIEFMFSLKHFKEYNQNAFSGLVKSIDDFLHIVRDIERGVEECKHNIDLLLDLKTVCLNHMHSFWINVPPEKIYKLQIQQSVDNLHKLLQKHITNSMRFCTDRGDILVVDDDAPMGYDPQRHHHDFY